MLEWKILGFFLFISEIVFSIPSVSGFVDRPSSVKKKN